MTTGTAGGGGGDRLTGADREAGPAGYLSKYLLFQLIFLTGERFNIEGIRKEKHSRWGWKS